MLRLKYTLRFVLFLMFPLPSLTFAQTGILQGTVTDIDGDPIARASVFVDKAEFSSVTNDDGEYRIEAIPAGTYVFRATAPSYVAQAVTITIQTGQMLVQDFALRIDLQAMEELVVTGSTTPEKKIESSTSVSSLSQEEIDDAAPRSTTEFLRRIPGFTRVESSGGEVNQNLSVRGLLGFTSVNIQEDGMMVYPSMETFFMNADNLIRPDENLEKIEILRGGTSPIFGSSTAGATLNLLNKTGGSVMAGTWKLIGGTADLLRFDFNLNGPLSDDWRFSLGGFYRYDHGVRDPGYPATRGGQLKLNITRLLSNGFFRISLKHIDDKNLFILPLPFQNPDIPEYVPGFSNTGSLYSSEAVGKIPLPNGTDVRLSVDDGIHTKGTWLTGQFNFNFGEDWQFENITRVMSVEHNWNALFSFDLLSASDYAQGVLNRLISEGKVPQTSMYQLFFTNHFGSAGNKLPFDTADGADSTWFNMAYTKADF